MRHDIGIEGPAFRLRPIALGDCRFVLDLRTDPRLSRFLHPTSPRIEDQERWMGDYLARPGDYYFVVERLTTGAPVGTAALYDHDPGTGTMHFGRWVVSPPSMAAPESLLLSYRVAFGILGLEAVVLDVAAQNAKVASFHDQLRTPRVGYRPQAITLGGTLCDVIDYRVDRAAWTDMEPRLEEYVTQVALVLNR